MNTKVYFDNLAVTTTENELMDLFSAYGGVAVIRIAVDHTSQQPRGFGFVTMTTPEGARAAIEALNGKAIGTGTLAVSEGWVNDEDSGSPIGRRPRRKASQLY